MALADTGKAIGAVSQLLRDRLLARLAGTVSNVRIGKPEMSGEGITNPRLNLFLYEIQIDSHLRNRSLDPGQSTPLWLVLKYLLTAFDEAGDSDSIESHEYLGEGMRVLQELSFLPLISLPPDVFQALNPNPEALKITFDPTSSELISKLMQGAEEKYRCSVGFEVRPVMIATAELSSYSLLVGVDYVNDTIIGAKGIQIPVLPSMGPKIDAIAPLKISHPLPAVFPDTPQPSILTIRGNNLALSNLTVRLGPVELPIVAKSPDTLKCELNGNIRDGTVISAGSHPVCVVESLPNGKARSSNLLVASLLPVITGAAFSDGNLNLEGFLLGKASDDVFVALYQNGKTVRVFDKFVEMEPDIPAQTQLQVEITDPSPGTYRVILRVNGQQAQNSPEVTVQ